MKSNIATIVLVAGALPSAALAQQPSPWSVRALLPSCESVIPKLGAANVTGLTFEEGRCLGVVVSALQFGSTWFPADKKSCPPTTYNTGQVVDAVVRHIRLRLDQATDKASVLDLPFTIAAAAGLFVTFPCKKG